MKKSKSKPKTTKRKQSPKIGGIWFQDGANPLMGMFCETVIKNTQALVSATGESPTVLLSVYMLCALAARTTIGQIFNRPISQVEVIEELISDLEFCKKISEAKQADKIHVGNN